MYRPLDSGAAGIARRHFPDVLPGDFAALQRREESRFACCVTPANDNPAAQQLGRLVVEVDEGLAPALRDLGAQMDLALVEANISQLHLAALAHPQATPIHQGEHAKVPQA